VLLWCTVINYGVLLVWFFAFMLAHDWIYQLHSRWFQLPVEQFEMLHYAGISIYKNGQAVNKHCSSSGGERGPPLVVLG